MHLPKKRSLLRVVLFLILLASCAHAPGSLKQVQTPPWKFAVLSDTQGNRTDESRIPYINENVLAMIVHDLVQEQPDFVLVAGDLVNGWLHNGGAGYPTQFEAWKKIMKPVYDAGIRVYPVRGNHEDGPERFTLPPLPARLEPPAGTQKAIKEAFRQAFNQDYIPLNGPTGEEGLTYSFHHKNVFIIGLDVFASHQHKVNQAWLDEQLSSRTYEHLFVYGHEPAFGVCHIDNLSFYPHERDQFWNSIGKAGGRVYFCGHDHIYNRAVINDEEGNAIYQIVCGTGGGTPRTWPGEYAEAMRVKGEYEKSGLYGYVLVTIEGPEVTISWKAITQDPADNAWQGLDTFSYSTDEKKDMSQVSRR